MTNNYYQKIKFLDHDIEKLTEEEKLSILLNHSQGYDIEFTQQNNCEGRLILIKDNKRFKELRIVSTKGKSDILRGDDVTISFWSSPKTEPNFKNPKRSTHAAKAIKAMYEKIADIIQKNQDILKEYNAV